ncbi:MAG: NUDIX hydrolase [Candidatus Korobacteraceae bacterium]
MPTPDQSTPIKTAPAKKPKSLPLKKLSSKIVFRGRVFEITRDRVREPNGVTAVREVIRHSGSVVVLAVDDSAEEPRVLMETQYRYAAQSYMFELPAGRIDPGEDAFTAGKRELREETGYTARRWKRALFFYPSPGFLEETMTVFLAQGLKPGIAQPESDERIEHRLIPLSEVLRQIMSSRIRDGKTIASVLWFVQSQKLR